MTAPPHSPLPYRSDIDGLRAIAVLAVVLYHFGFPPHGGFAGVDVFFVISGFLIGGILWREYDATGRIWLANFYVRRFRRLAPAFFVMVAVCAALGWMLLLPFEYREFGKTAIAATVFLSNALFYRQTGYFDAAAEDKPLLHTWSLAVEEQFYIFLPLLILLLSRRRAVLLAALVGCWAASLAACVWLTPSHPAATFYLFPFRAWELLSGVLLAIWGQSRGLRWRGHPLLSWTGLALVILSVAVIPAGDSFPGLLALLPVLGTLALLSSGTGENTVNRLLTLPVMNFFGRISYSLYLWHWPVWTFSTYLRDGHANLLESAAWMALSVGLAWLSWRFVEQPVRQARRLSGGVVLVATATASAATLALGAALYLRDGLPTRFDPAARPHIAASGDFLQDWSRCYIAWTLPLDGLEVCPIGPEGPPQILIWGDSHVRSLHAGLDLAAHDASVPGLILWRAGCPPLFDLRKVESAATPAQDTACTQANLQIKQALPRLDSVDRIVLVGRWAYYATGEGVGLDTHNTISLHSTTGETLLNEPQAARLVRAAQGTVDDLLRHGKSVFVVRQPPEIPQYDSRRAAREAAHAGLPLAATPVIVPTVPEEALALRAGFADAPWTAPAESGAITLLDPWPFLCEAGTCRAVIDGTGQYFDNNHLTNSAARRLRGLFAPVFETAATTARAAETGE